MTASSPSAAARPSMPASSSPSWPGRRRPVWDFEDIGDWWTRADADKIAPIVAVPTTAGTGSEVGRAGVITNEATHTKKVIFHPKMMPKVVICDPELTVGMPPFITAGTGMDALAHCLEAYCAPSYHPMADGIAVEGMRLVFENLPKAVAERQRPRGARPHDERGGDGRDRLPEGARRDPCAVASGRRALRHPSRHDQRRVHALCARLQPQGDRGEDRAARRLSRHRRRVRRLPRMRARSCASKPAFRTTLAGSKSTAARSRPSSRCRSSIRPPAATPFR